MWSASDVEERLQVLGVRAAMLLLVDFDLVVFIHLQASRRVVVSDAAPVVEEAEGPKGIE